MWVSPFLSRAPRAALRLSLGIIFATGLLTATEPLSAQPPRSASKSPTTSFDVPTTTDTPSVRSNTFRSGNDCSGASGASIATLLNFWGPVTPQSTCYDFNHDGVISSADLAVLLSSPPEPLAPLVRPLTTGDIFHLYKRAAFGYVSHDTLAKLTGVTVDTAVNHLFDVQPDTSAELKGLEWKDETCCNVFEPITGKEKNPGAPKLNTTTDGVTLYTLVKMGETRNPAIEFLVFRVLHELVTAGVSAVNRDWADRMLMIRNEVPGQPTHLGYFDLLRKTAIDGDFKALIKAVTRLPVMLRYLNGDTNVASQPNQNYARELMELFTLGPTDLAGNPNYTNTDIGEAARALTGLQISEIEVDSGSFRQPYRRYIVAEQTSSPGFDPGVKQLFAGTENRCLAVTADDLIDCIFSHRGAGSYLANQLAIHYIRTDIASTHPEIIAALARDLETNGFNIVATIKRLLKSEFFYRAENRDSLLRSPMEKGVHVYRALRDNGMNFMLPPCAYGDTSCYTLCPNGSSSNCAYFANPAFNAPLKPTDLLSIAVNGSNTPGNPPNVFAWRDQAKYFASATGLITTSNGIVAPLSHYFFNTPIGPNSAFERWGFVPSDLIPTSPNTVFFPPLHVSGTHNYNAHRDAVIRHIARLLSFEPSEAQMSVARDFMDSHPKSLTNGTYSFRCLCQASAAATHPDGLTTPASSCTQYDVECGLQNAPWNPNLFNQVRTKVFGLLELFLDATEFNT